MANDLFSQHHNTGFALESQPGGHKLSWLILTSLFIFRFSQNSLLHSKQRRLGAVFQLQLDEVYYARG